MRGLLWAPLLLVVLSGCLESQTTVEAPEHDHCWFLCGGQQENHVHFDWFPPLLALLVLGLIVGIVVAVAASAGRGGQQQQQQVVVYTDREQDLRR